MSGYLRSLARVAVGHATTLKARPVSRFEPQEAPCSG